MQIVTSLFSTLTSMTGAVWTARLAVAWLLAAGPGAAAEDWVKEDYTLAPEVEKKWQGWMDAARPGRVKKETERMAGVIAGLKKNHGLDEARVRVLEGVVPGLVKATVRDWEQFLRQIHRPSFQGPAKLGLEGMAVFKQDPVEMMTGHEIAHYLLPQEREAFVRAVREALPLEAFARWDAGRLKRLEERNKRAPEWVEAGIKERKPAQIYAGELAKALEEGQAVLGKDSDAGKALARQVETWAAAYEQTCREVSLLRVNSFVYPTGPGWVESMQRGWFLFLPRRAGTIHLHREDLKKMTMEGGGAALLAEAAKRWEPEDFKLDPAVDLAWEAHIKQARPQNQKLREEKLGKEVERLQKEHGLNETGATRLRAAVPELAKAVLPDWEQSMRTLFRHVMVGEPGPSMARLKDRYSPGVLAGFPAPVSKETVNSEAWEKLVKRELSAEEFEKWRKARDEGLKQRAEEMKALVAEGRKKSDPEARLKQAFERALSSDLPQEDEGAAWRKTMEADVDKQAKRYAEACEQRACLALEAREHEGTTWQTARKNGSYFYTLDTADWVKRNREEIMKLLPAEVTAAHAKAIQARAERSQKTVKLWRMMTLELMTALSDEQRQAAERLADKTAVTEEELAMVTDLNATPRLWRVWALERAGRELAEILDDRQQRLVTKGLASLEQGNSSQRSTEELKPARKRHPAEGPADPSEVEAVVSQYLAQVSRDHAQRGLESLLRQVERVVRVLNLEDSARAALELAARGTAQAAVETHRTNQGRYVRSQIQGVGPENIHERLKTVGGYSFYMGREGTTLVESTLDELIIEEQRKLLEAHQDELVKRRTEAILQMALTRMEKTAGLSGAQLEKLAELLRGVMQKYGPDIEQNFQSWGERTPWYLQSYYLMLPLSGVAEADLKALLNEKQQGSWSEAATQGGGHYWEQIMSYHDRRMNSPATTKPKRRIFFEP